MHIRLSSVDKSSGLTFRDCKDFTNRFTKCEVIGRFFFRFTADFLGLVTPLGPFTPCLLVSSCHRRFELLSPPRHRRTRLRPIACLYVEFHTVGVLLECVSVASKYSMSLRPSCSQLRNFSWNMLMEQPERVSYPSSPKSRLRRRSRSLRLSVDIGLSPAWSAPGVMNYLSCWRTATTASEICLVPPPL